MVMESYSWILYCFLFYVLKFLSRIFRLKLTGLNEKSFPKMTFGFIDICVQTFWSNNNNYYLVFSVTSFFRNVTDQHTGIISEGIM